MKIREWHTQLGWSTSAIFATGALWYFISIKNFCFAWISAALAAAFIAFTVLLHKIRDGSEHSTEASPAALASGFKYEPYGRFGKNILSNATHEVPAGQAASMQAIVPPGSQLHVVLAGLPAIYLDDGNAGWSFSIVAIEGWAPGRYQATHVGGEQHFDAKAGSADLKIAFSREGSFEVKAYEGADREPTWTRTIQVHVA